MKKPFVNFTEGFFCFRCIKKALIAQSFFVGPLGLEPRKTAPKTVVLPLHHGPLNLQYFCVCFRIASANIRMFFVSASEL